MQGRSMETEGVSNDCSFQVSPSEDMAQLGQHGYDSSLDMPSEIGPGETATKKSKKRTNVWTKTTSRKSTKKKKGPKNGGVRPSDVKDDVVVLKPFHQEDDPSYPILLSKIHKAEKVELSADRLTASAGKGYRMVRATRGVVEGAWYFEIYVENLGESGHTRLGWSSRKGDIQAPVGYDAHSYAYRDVDGSKVHCAIRETYGNVYHVKDCIGFYIRIPRDANYVRKDEEELVGWKGHPYVVLADEPLKPVPGSEILFFKNGVCQGVAFKDINDGTYFPAASMYTLPNQDMCRIAFNFGPDFRYPPIDIGDRPVPSPMCDAPGPARGANKADGAPKAHPEGYSEPFEKTGIKHRMVPDHDTTMKVQQKQPVPKKEKVPPQPKRVVKPTPPLPKKKVHKILSTTTKSKLISQNNLGLKNGVPSIVKKIKMGNGVPTSNPKVDMNRSKGGKSDSVGTGLILSSNGLEDRPWATEGRIDGAQVVDVEVVVEAPCGVD